MPARKDSHPPRIDSRDALRDRLDDKPPEWARAVAARAALRVAPLVFPVFDIPDKSLAREHKRVLILSVFRASFISWAARKYPAHDMAAYANATADAAYAANAAYANATAYAADAADAANAAAAANAANAAYAAYAAAAANAANAAEAAYAVAANAANAADAADAATYANAAAELWKATDADVRWLSENADGAALIDQPLWLMGDVSGRASRASMPPWTRKPLEDFWNSEWCQTGHWGLTVQWYRALLSNNLDGTPRSLFGKAKDIELATKPEAFWDRDPEEVISEIAELVGWVPPAKRAADDDNIETIEIPGQQRAPIETAVVDGQIVRLHQLPSHSEESVAATHAILVREAAWLAARVSGQYPDALTSFEALTVELGADLEAVQVFGVGYWATVLAEMTARVDEMVLEDAAGRFAGFVASLDRFLKQFPEWRSYIEVAQNAEISLADSAETEAEANRVVDSIMAGADVVADDVTGPLQAVRKAFLASADHAAEAAYGFYQSLANISRSLAEMLVDKGGRFVASVGSELSRQTPKAAAAAILTAAGSAFLYLAAAMPNTFGFLQPLLRILGVAG